MRQVSETALPSAHHSLVRPWKGPEHRLSALPLSLRKVQTEKQMRTRVMYLECK